MRRKRYWTNATSKIDIAAAVVGIVALVAIVPILVMKGYLSAYLLADAVALVCIVAYLIMRKRLTWKFGGDTVWFWVCLSLACVFLCLAIEVFVGRADQYVKPLWYFILSAVVAGWVFMAALFANSRKQGAAIAGMACVVGLLHIWTDSIMFPNSLIGIDTWMHMRTTLNPLPLSALGGSYSLMHIYLKAAMDITHLGYKWASLIFVGSVQLTATIVFAYLIARRLFNYRVAAVTALVMAVAGWALSAGVWTIPNYLGATFSLAVAYCMIRIYKDRKYWLVVPVLLILVAAFLTHILAAGWVVGTIFCLLLFPLVFEPKPFREKVLGFVRVLPIAIVLIVGVVVWFRATSVGGAIISTARNIQVAGVTQKGQLGSFGELAINGIGMILFISLAAIGLLAMLRLKPHHKAWVVMSVAILMAGIVPSVFGIDVIAQRWWYFAEVLLAVPLGLALVSFRRWAVVLIVPLAFFNTIGLPANITNRALSPNQIVRYAFTDREMQAIQLAEFYNPKMIAADPIYAEAIVADPTMIGKVEWLDTEIFDRDFSKCKADTLLLRDALYREPFGFGNGDVYQLGYSPIATAESQGYKLLWDNGDVACLIR